MSDENKCCLNCKIHWDREGGCEVCRWEDENNPSLFYRITRSPETLAEKLVYCEKWTITSEHPEKGKEYEYWSTPLIDMYYPTKAEAIAATVAKLKEVAE